MCSFLSYCVIFLTTVFADAQLLSNVTVTPLDSTSLAVTWTPLTQYQSRDFNVTVSTQLLGNGNCDNLNGPKEVIGPLVTKPSTIPVTSLKSYSRYNVSLQVRLIGSTVQDVFTQVVMTRAVAPTGQVTLSVVQVTKGSVEITWNDLSCPDRKGVDLYYYVKLSITNSPQSGFLADYVHGNVYSWDTLKSNTNYTVRVSAVNEVGQGPYSEVNVQTLQSGPDSVEIISMTSTYSSVQIMHQIALTTGQLVYQIAYSQSSQFTGYTTVRTASSNGILTIEGLSANTTYYFKVCAIENNIPGPYGSSKSILTVELITLELVNHTADCVGFTWAPPSSRLNTWTYKMAIEKIHLTSDLNVYQTSVYTCGLIPSSQYTIKITAYNNGTLMSIGSMIFNTGDGLHLQIDATPTTIIAGLTQTLDIKCHTFINSSSQMESLISLIITRSGQGPDKELASINVFSPDSHVVDVSNEIITASGKIDNLGESFLRLIWKFPDINNRGIYVCEAHGISHTGHPVNLTSTVSVSQSYANSDELVNQINNLTLEIEIEKEQCASNLKTKLDLIKTFMFTVSPPYNGHHYLLSNRLYTYQVDLAESACEQFGGYLVEIDTADEYQFLANFLIDEAKKIDIYFVLTGISDEQQENVWVNRHSHTLATFLKWLESDPNGGRSQNCIVLYFPDWLMIDDDCYSPRSDFAFKMTYLCEVPY